MTKIPQWNGKVLPDHHISYAFTCGETHYFNFTDAFNIPSGRAHDAMHIYQQYSNRIDDEFLRENSKARQNIYTKNPIVVFDLKKLDDQIDERLNMQMPPPRMIEQLASVYYFDQNENPYTFDRAYGEQKVKKWRSTPITIIDEDGEKETHDFFLSPPIRSLIPFSELQEQDFQMYLRIAEKVDELHLKTISGYLSLQQQKTSLYSRHYLPNDTEKMTA